MRKLFNISPKVLLHPSERWPEAWMEVLEVEMVVECLLNVQPHRTRWWIRGRWRKEQNQEQLLEFFIGNWVDIDVVYWDRKDRRWNRFKCGGGGSKSSVWDLLSLRCLWATQVEILKTPSNVGLKREVRDAGTEWNHQHTLYLSFRAMKTQTQWKCL